MLDSAWVTFLGNCFSTSLCGLCGHHPINSVSYSDFRDSVYGRPPTSVLECHKNTSLLTCFKKILLSQEQLGNTGLSMQSSCPGPEQVKSKPGEGGLRGKARLPQETVLQGALESTSPSLFLRIDHSCSWRSGAPQATGPESQVLADKPHVGDIIMAQVEFCAHLLCCCGLLKEALLPGHRYAELSAA